MVCGARALSATSSSILTSSPFAFSSAAALIPILSSAFLILFTRWISFLWCFCGFGSDKNGCTWFIIKLPNSFNSSDVQIKLTDFLFRCRSVVLRLNLVTNLSERNERSTERNMNLCCTSCVLLCCSPVHH